MSDLYRAQTVVTGQDNLPERRRGIQAALAELLVKVSGDAHLPSHREFPAVVGRAEAMVVRSAYEDRKKGIQISDEQGTRDRSYVLTVEFDPAAIDGTLAELDARPWMADRPRLLVVLGVRDTLGAYVLGTASERGYGQREVLLGLSRRRGIPLSLPAMDEDDRRLVDLDGLMGGAPATEGLTEGSVPLVPRAEADLRVLQDKYRADAVLVGRMSLTPAGEWATAWRLDLGSRSPRTGWSAKPATFDRSIEGGLDGAARRLADLPH